jgi:excisionase family DNA binding protein
MPKKGHRIAPEVKTDILRRIKEDGITVQQAATDHGIHETTIYTWLTKGAEGAPTLGELVRLKKENTALLQLVGDLTLQLSVGQKKR